MCASACKCLPVIPGELRRERVCVYVFYSRWGDGTLWTQIHRCVYVGGLTAVTVLRIRMEFHLCSISPALLRLLIHWAQMYRNHSCFVKNPRATKGLHRFIPENKEAVRIWCDIKLSIFSFFRLEARTGIENRVRIAFISLIKICNQCFLPVLMHLTIWIITLNWMKSLFCVERAASHHYTVVCKSSYIKHIQMISKHWTQKKYFLLYAHYVNTQYLLHLYVYIYFVG